MAKQFLLYARVFRWHDGDTFYGILDHGCRIYQGTEAKLPTYRCAKINAPELGTPEADAATAYANKIAPPGEYQCWSTGLDEYGRPLIDLIVPGGLFYDLMLIAGHAKLYKTDWFPLGMASQDILSDDTVEIGEGLHERTVRYADGGSSYSIEAEIEDDDDPYGIYRPRGNEVPPP
jgi:endonuclease YncB( thermonuclease family)